MIYSTYTQLDIVFAQEHGASSKGRYSTLGGYSRTRTPLAKGHGDRLACQRAREVGPAMAGLDISLVFSSIADESGELGRREISYGEQVSGCEGRCERRSWGARAGVGAALQLGQASEDACCWTEGSHFGQWSGYGLRKSIEVL